MFDWLRKPKDPSPKELGERAVASMAADLDAFMQARFNPVFNSMLDVLRGRLDEAIDVEGTDAPPLMRGQVEYEIFVENVDDVRARMLGEVQSAMGDWLKFAREADLTESLQAYLEHQVDTFLKNLKLAGLSLLSDYADRLKEADDNWRAQNPSLALQFPPEA